MSHFSKWKWTKVPVQLLSCKILVMVLLLCAEVVVVEAAAEAAAEEKVEKTIG